jgi:hypothetical protein
MELKCTAMLKRTGHWWNRRRIWHYDSSPEKRTADRPHKITIVIGVLSPLLAIAAVTISLQGVKTSRTAMEVGQRAYLSISDGRLSVSGDQAHYSYVLHNLGNTPAESVSVKYMHTGKDIGGVSILDDERIPDIGPKDSRTYQGTLRVDPGFFPLKMTGLAYYRDAFGEEHSLDWCWSVDVAGVMRECTTDSTLWRIFPRSR